MNHITTTGGQQVEVDCVSIHQDYVDGITQTGGQDLLYSDVAVIKLAASVTTTTTYVTLNSDTSFPIGGQPVVAIGFGLTSGGGTLSSSLLKITESLIPEADCQECSSDCISSAYHVCARVDPGGVCQGK